MTHNSIPDWRRFVYHKNYKKEKLSDDWFKALAHCLKRDHYICQRCEKAGSRDIGSAVHISAHHIIPRGEGGGNNVSNLITLCDPCHDYVEVNELKTKVDIIGSYEDEVNQNLEAAEAEEKRKRITDEGYHFIRPEWHKYVYGGQKRRK